MMWGLRMENCQNKILGWAKLIRSNILHMGKVWFRETSNLCKVTEFIGHRQSLQLFSLQHSAGYLLARS